MRLHRRPPPKPICKNIFTSARLGSPDGAHTRTRSIIRRQPRVARSIEMLIDPNCLPELLNRINLSKSLCSGTSAPASNLATDAISSRIYRYSTRESALSCWRSDRAALLHQSRPCLAHQNDAGRPKSRDRSGRKSRELLVSVRSTVSRVLSWNGSGKSLEMRFESIGVGSEAKQRVTGRYRSCCSALTPWRLVVLRHKMRRMFLLYRLAQ